MENILGISKRTIAITSLLFLCTIVLAASVSLYKSNTEHRENERCRTIQQTLTSKGFIDSNATIGDDGVPVVEINLRENLIFSDDSTYLHDVLEKAISALPEEQFVLKIPTSMVVFSYDNRTKAYRISGTDNFMRRASFTTQDAFKFYGMKENVDKCFHDSLICGRFWNLLSQMNKEAALKVLEKELNESSESIYARVMYFSHLKYSHTFDEIENYERLFEGKNPLR